MPSSLPRSLVPATYELDEEHRFLHISWSDGHESLHGYEPLRKACPCAWCAGEGGYPGNLTSDTVLSEQETTLYELKLVGRYGLSPVWGDGHNTGIYTYERLREICECDECSASS
jgi:DUF971 family protein